MAVGPLLAEAPEIAERVRVQTLDGNDNALTDRRRHTGPSGFWSDQVLPTYVRSVLNLVRQRLTPQADDDWGIRRTGSELPEIEISWCDPVVRQCEVYFEFQVEDAISFVSQFDRHLATTLNRSETRIFPIGQARGEGDAVPARFRNQNAYGLSFPLGANGVRLAIYAKLPDRVRFEVRYSCSIASVSPRLSRSEIEYGAEGVVQLLEKAAVNAHRRLEPVFRALPRFDIGTRPNWLTLVSLLIHLSTACGNDRVLMGRVLSHLAYDQALSSDAGIPTEVVEQLQDCGVLETVRVQLRNPIPRLAVVPSYRRTLEALREVVDIPQRPG